MDDVIFENYKKSLEQKYNAVCFDIDGTLTRPNSKELDQRAVDMIVNLLKRKVPVVFITGRGETGLIHLKNDLYSKLTSQHEITKNDLSRIYCITNDGARLFFTDKKDTNNDFFNNSVYLVSKSQLNQLEEFNNKIISSLNLSLLKDYCNVTYSKDLKEETILNIRLIFNSNNENIINSVFNIVKDVIVNNNLQDIYITRGIYKNNVVLQIGIAKKEIAINKTEEIIGVPKKSMIRIGDCGDLMGNDYSMLNCEQGYSVDRISNAENTCFPIFDDTGKILKGVEATLFLISKAKILPTVCLERSTKDDYKDNYAKIEYEINKGKNEHFKYYNEIINQVFKLSNGFYDLFDESSGSIKIPMYEWELIKNNSLKDLWNINDKDKLYYSIRDDDNYLLRGSKTYYYFLANRESINGKDNTSLENVIEWHKNNSNFLSNSIIAIDKTNDLNSNINKKFILGILDNVRNILLVLMNFIICDQYDNKNVLLKLNKNDDSTINRLYKILYFTDELMSQICFDPNLDIDKIKLKMIINLTNREIVDNFLNIKNYPITKNYSKDFRAYREIDNFIENYITIELCNKKNNVKQNFGVCGLSYGGIELPIIYSIVNKNIDDILILHFNKNVSGYTNKQLLELRKFNIDNYGGLLISEEIKSEDIILLDDNILSGKSMQLATNVLYDAKYNVKNINIVRYTKINRIDQMFGKNPGAVDYNLFFDYIIGLCFPCPYSWRDSNSLDQYEDSLGVFDLNRKKILECLAKNGDYFENSEIFKVKEKKKMKSKIDINNWGTKISL